MIAVLTGDLVHSTKMTNKTYANVIQSLKNLLNEANEKYDAIGEIYRGDEFQIQYPNPVYALKSTLLLKLALHLSSFSPKPIQCTLSLAFGDHNIYGETPNTSSGEVFIQSGRGLAKTQRGELSIQFAQQTHTYELNLLTQFLNHLLSRLTKTQAELLFQYIESSFAEHKKLAEITGTTRQNISNRLANIGAFLVRDYMEVINEKVMQLQRQR
ncbi:hypothetical protein [Thalassotalea sp. SU-HH00458]|uniref:hypothetical protein n=1 Tax=Thalassotalea sp. SU-HH00458 TaxID=3127657 RepID=UPI003106561E